MAGTYVGVGALASSLTAPIDVTGPVCQAGDILFCVAKGEPGASVIALTGGWTELKNEAIAGAPRKFFAWKVAGPSDSEASWTLSKSSGDEVHGIVFAFRGANALSPLDATGAALRTSAVVNEAVFFPANYDPAGTDVHVIAVAMYFSGSTNFTTVPTGSNPALTLRFDTETAIGAAGFSVAVASGDNNGAAFSIPQWNSNSAVDSLWTGLIVALNTSVSGGGTGAGHGLTTFLRRKRRGV